MQYWKPDAKDQFAGDMMPFWDGETFHLFYLLDRDHHAEQGGLGGHQWAHASTTDLLEWEHYPLALPIGAPGSVDQHGICTGSIFEQDGVYHAFYATRLRAEDGAVSEVVCRAVSRDLIHFDKSAGNPMFGAPPGYDAGHHRDPFVFRHAETGLYHMLVTASRAGDGVLAHYTSENLDDWTLQEPFLTGNDGHSPECPEHFFWNGWWYLVFSRNGEMQYRISRDPLGPWQSAARETIEPSPLAVPRTAEFTGGRRIAVGFLPWREDERDDKGYVYAGSAVFREVFQEEDGTLTTRFVPEMMPPLGEPVPVSSEVSVESGEARIDGIPVDGTLTLRLTPGAGTEEYGLLLRADDALTTAYRLRFLPSERRVLLHPWPESSGEAALLDVAGLDQPLDLVICLQGSVIDVCLNNSRTLITRGYAHRGTHSGLFAAGGSAQLEVLSAAPSKSSEIVQKAILP